LAEWGFAGLNAMPIRRGMEFFYRLTGAGWSVARIGDERGWAEIPASYLSDALGDLLAALVRLGGGDSEARFSWDSEPAEYRWILRRDGGEVAVRILWFYDIYKSQHDEAGKLVFETRRPLAELRRVIAAAAAQVLAELGEDGYRDHWVEHPFPTAALRALAEE
jgi:hypothetical protein